MGAQKAGTSWLYRYLKDHPECAMGPIKEYAVFSSVFRPDLFSRRTIGRLQRLQGLAKSRSESLARGEAAPAPARLLNLMDSLSLALDPWQRYVPYFDRLVAARPAARLTGDITPVYSTLEAEHFRQIRDLLEGGGYRVKVVFLMRDPVERCFSALRMGARDGRRKGGAAQPPKMQFVREATRQWCEIRTRYEHTIAALEAVFAQEDLFYGFHESFITPEGVHALTDFLGVAYREPDLDKRVNASPRTVEPDSAERAQVRAHYRAPMISAGSGSGRNSSIRSGPAPTAMRREFIAAQTAAA